MTDYPAKYMLFNAQQSKNLALVMKVEGVADLFSITDLFTTIRYGDPDVKYGAAGLVYGGLRRLTNVRPYITLDGSLTIGQRIEPEQGRGNVFSVHNSNQWVELMRTLLLLMAVLASGCATTMETK